MKDQLLTGTKTTFYSFGCSYTNFAWPTWANFVGTQFDRHISYAQSGAGNRYIFLSVLDALQNHTIREGDVFVVQWSSLCREDRIKPNDEVFKTPGYLDYQSEYPEVFTKEMFNPQQQFVELRNYIFALKTIFESHKITYRMTNMYEPYLGKFLGEPVLSEMNEHFHGFLLKTGAIRALKQIMKDFLVSIENKIPERDCWYYVKYGSHLDIQTDDHPTCFQHLSYAKYVYHDIFKNYGDLGNERMNEIVKEFKEIFTNKEEVIRLADNDLMDTLVFPEHMFDKELIYKRI